MSSDIRGPLINKNKSLQDYYASLESRIGYRLVLGGTRHFGFCTMETFVHATDPEVAAAEFFRVIRPGGRIAMYEYDHVDFTTQPKEVSDSWTTINKHSSMPAYGRFQRGVLPSILEDTGFEDVEVKDLSENVLPMLRLFYVLAIIPYRIITFLGLKPYFINTVTGYEGYIYKDAARYILVSGTIPLATSEMAPNEGKKLRRKARGLSRDLYQSAADDGRVRGQQLAARFL